ncbi:TPA: hypothetical protein N0F65_004946 [Lagenidium giganteum]|uniref:Uncharacterized protein n=1 Tax=Lagenidium giganteum TaxID=4803 RepID=A0AAV2YYY1_9STRA|nr:TPA: hypothetical protein N0F65_004946 [Lagenidium giganteum]
MSSLFQRLISMVVNDVAIKALSNNRAFQRFALKTHYRVEDAKNIASTGATSLFDGIAKAAPKVKQFSSALKDEISRDINKFK